MYIKVAVFLCVSDILLLEDKKKHVAEKKKKAYMCKCSMTLRFDITLRSRVVIDRKEARSRGL